VIANGEQSLSRLAAVVYGDAVCVSLLLMWRGLSAGLMLCCVMLTCDFAVSSISCTTAISTAAAYVLLHSHSSYALPLHFLVSLPAWLLLLQIPGVPIMYLSQHRYSIERLPEATIGGAPRT
jgi:hypothetical protein